MAMLPDTDVKQLIDEIRAIHDAEPERADERITAYLSKRLSGYPSEQARAMLEKISVRLHSGRQESFEKDLLKINQAFQKVQEAFKLAARAKVEQILKVLDPKKIAAERGSGGLKIGPLRKADDYDVLTHRIERLQRWFDSGRFMEDLIKAFEENCRHQLKKDPFGRT